MFITVNGIIGEKTIDLSYLIWNFDSGKVVAVMSMFSNNVEYEMKEPLGLKLINGGEKQVPKKTCTRRGIRCDCRKRTSTYRFRQRFLNN